MPEAVQGTRTPPGGVRPLQYELRFRALRPPHRAFAFPCDSDGRVELDALTERQRHDYLFVRALTGRAYDQPQVLPAARH